MCKIVCIDRICTFKGNIKQGGAGGFTHGITREFEPVTLVGLQHTFSRL